MRCKQRLKPAEEGLASLRSQAPPAPIRIDPDLPGRIHRAVENLENTIGRDVARAREEIKRLVGEEILLFPVAEGHLEAEVRLYPEKVLMAASGGPQISVATPAGFELALVS